MKSLFRKKPLSTILKDAEQGLDDDHGGKGLKKVLGVRDLTSMGIAAVIGAGIFSTIGQAAYNGGPGVVFLFLITAVTCGFTALCYAEFASRVPVAGSAYTYSYVTFGELVAWVIGGRLFWSMVSEMSGFQFHGAVILSIYWKVWDSTYPNGLPLIQPQRTRNLFRHNLQALPPMGSRGQRRRSSQDIDLYATFQPL